MAWIQLDVGGGAYVLRKPLGKTPEEQRLSCWGWYVGMPAERVDFGLSLPLSLSLSLSLSLPPSLPPSPSLAPSLARARLL